MIKVFLEEREYLYSWTLYGNLLMAFIMLIVLLQYESMIYDMFILIAHTCFCE